MLQVLYLVHDLSDPAVRRRVSMLRAGGAKVTLAGFRRTPQPITDINGLTPVDLGHTQDGRFAQRMAAVARAVLSAPRTLKALPVPDVIIARNMEMLVVARRARSAFSGRVPIVYECLDIHRLMLREDLVGRGLRFAERLLGQDVKLLMTSSPAFIKNYFQRFGQMRPPSNWWRTSILGTWRRTAKRLHNRRTTVAHWMVWRAEVPAILGTAR